VTTIEMSHASAMACKSWCQEGAGHADRWDRIDRPSRVPRLQPRHSAALV